MLRRRCSLIGTHASWVRLGILILEGMFLGLAVRPGRENGGVGDLARERKEHSFLGGEGSDFRVVRGLPTHPAARRATQGDLDPDGIPPF